MQASKLEKDANNAKSKCVQVVFVTNIQVMLECFISLYELRKSSLQEVFLRPCSQFEEEYDPTENEFIKKDRVSKRLAQEPQHNLFQNKLCENDFHFISD